MQTVGEILRNERENKGLSVKDVATATSIRALYIEAIEEGNYTVIPGEVYVKGFIRNYANFLELNGPEMVGLYRRQQAPPVTPDAGDAAASTTAAAAVSGAPAATAGSFRWILAGAAVVVIAGAVWWFNSRPDTPLPVPRQSVQNQTPAPNQPGQQPIPAPAATPQSKPIVLSVKYSGDCWTQVVADGKEIYEGIARSGQSLSWEASKNLTIKLGNAGSAEATYNGQPVGKLGDKGEVVVKTFTAKN